MADCTCSTCGLVGLTDDEFKTHCKTPFHTFNLKRKVAGLKPVSLAVWEEKKAAAEAASDGASSAPSNRAWLQKQAKYEKKKAAAKAKAAKAHTAPPVRSAYPSAAAEDDEDESLERTDTSAAPAEPFTVKHCLFDNKVFDSMDENLEYMASTYSLFIPDREYLKDQEGLLLYLGEKVHQDFTCLFCNKIFGSMPACRSHMIDRGHTRIGTDSDTLLGEISPFYDFSESHKEIVTKLGVRPGRTLPVMEEETTAESGEDDKKVSDDEGEWEECDSDASGELLEVHECEDEDEFAAVLQKYGLERAELLPSGDLRLPNGSVACHRSVAYVYRQKFRPVRGDTDRSQEGRLNEKRRQLCLTGVRDGQGASAAALTLAVGLRKVKEQNRQVLAILREQSKQYMKLGINASKGDRHGRNKPVKVNLYSWAK
jgi:pre-60S factor REI1